MEATPQPDRCTCYDNLPPIRLEIDVLDGALLTTAIGCLSALQNIDTTGPDLAPEDMSLLKEALLHSRHVFRLFDWRAKLISSREEMPSEAELAALHVIGMEVHHRIARKALLTQKEIAEALMCRLNGLPYCAFCRANGAPETRPESFVIPKGEDVL